MGGRAGRPGRGYSAAPEQGFAVSLPAWPYPLWIAHRGAGKLAPENTLAAFRVGAAHGYRAFECDVKLSADGVPFLLHDATLERTTDGRGAAAALPWSRIARLDAGAWHSPGFAGEPPPSLEAVARFCQANELALNIEIKPSPGCEEETGDVVAREAARLWQGWALPPLLSSFAPAALAAARRAVPALPRALLLEALAPDWLDTLRALDGVAAVTDHRLMDAALIGRLHGAGLRALVYTVNHAAQAQRLLALGVEGIITDAVDRLPMAPGAAEPAVRQLR